MKTYEEKLIRWRAEERWNDGYRIHGRERWVGPFRVGSYAMGQCMMSNDEVSE